MYKRQAPVEAMVKKFVELLVNINEPEPKFLKNVLFKLSANISQAVPLPAALVNLIADELLVFIVTFPLNIALVPVNVPVKYPVPLTCSLYPASDWVFIKKFPELVSLAFSVEVFEYPNNKLLALFHVIAKSPATAPVI